jgi:DNA-binding MarR family transcriptional regulator
VPDPRRLRRPGRAGTSPPSPAALGVVKVSADFTNEYPDGDPLTAETMATLVRAGQAITAELARTMLASYGVAQPVMTCLAVIEGAQNQLTPSEIGERMLHSSATVTNTLDALERLGWARRIPNPDDRRSVLVEITDEGQAVADSFLPGIRVLERALFSELTSAERATLLRLLGKVLKGTAAVAAAEPIPLEGRRNRPERRS